MSNNHQDAPKPENYMEMRQGVVARKLREAGYVPLPRWWVKPEDIEIIRRLTSHHAAEIFKLRDDAKLEKELQDYENYR